MRRIVSLFAAFAIVMPSAAFAAALSNGGKAKFSTQTLCQILQPCQPPAKFSSGAFLAPPSIKKVSLRQVQSICGGGRVAFLGKDAVETGPETVHAAKAAGGGFAGIMGCAKLTETSCVVHVPADLQSELPDLYKLVVEHELGHCRGWVHARY